MHQVQGAGKIMKTKRVTTLETHYTVVAFNGTRVPCGADKAKADALHAEWTLVKCQGEILYREVKKVESVPA